MIPKFEFNHTDNLKYIYTIYFSVIQSLTLTFEPIIFALYQVLALTHVYTLTAILVWIKQMVRELQRWWWTGTLILALWSWHLIRRPWHWQCMFPLLFSTCVQSLKPIRRINDNLLPKPICQQTMHFILIFDPMTLTLYEMLVLINVDPHVKVGFNLTNTIRLTKLSCGTTRMEGRTNRRTE